MKKLIFLIIIINLSLALTQVILSAKRATDGEELAELNSDLAQVKTENQRIKTSIYELSSLEHIQAKAADLQLSQVALQYQDLELPVAKLR